MRSELTESLDKMNERLALMTEANFKHQQQLTDMFSKSLDTIRRNNIEQNDRQSRIIAESIEKMQQSNEKKLDEMRATVDEKLSATLTTRLDSSFKTVSEQLENVYKSLGEMKELSTGVTTNVTNLNRVLTNVKARGTWAEVQLEGILDQTIPNMYVKNFSSRPGSSERVEFAIRIPAGDGGADAYLPVDSKFPLEDYVRLCTAADGADADEVAAARKAFESGAWSRMHPSERKKILMRFIGLIEKHQVELAVLESLDSGKPVRECLLTDLPETIECLEWHAECADKQYGGISPSGDGRLGLIVREPAGVVACVLPWNFPLMMVGWKLGPALAEGNSVILKPASVTSLSTLKLAEFAAEAGIPEGVFNVITGPGSSVGEALGLHPGVDVVSFTGSTEVGRRFLEYAARSNLKRIVLELGGKSPFVVLDDVADYAAVAAQAAAAAFWNMGENCTANSRIIVPRKRKDAFTEALLAELENWRIGDPLDPENNLGSIVSEGQFRTIMGYIEKGKAEGGHVLTGGAPLAIGSGLFIPPTIFDGVTPDMTIVREEIFGPVTAILPADSDEEAVGLANATAYGLQATLFTEDVTKAHKYARALKAGTVSVNCFSEGDNTTPFGGYKLSGFGGKDKGRESHDQYTETKTIFLNLDR